MHVLTWVFTDTANFCIFAPTFLCMCQSKYRIRLSNPWTGQPWTGQPWTALDKPWTTLFRPYGAHQQGADRQENNNTV